MEIAPEARCAAHPDTAADAICARCGDLVCGACLGPGDADTRVCAACRERLGLDRIAWEQAVGGWASRWWRTTRGVLFASVPTFSAATPGSPGRALGYLATVMLTVALVATLMNVLTFSSRVGLVALPAALPIFAFVLVAQAAHVLTRTLVFHAAVHVLGGRGLLRSVWGSAYAHAPLLFYAFVSVFAPLSSNGVVVAVLVLCTELWLFGELLIVAQHVHGLSGGRALLAGAAPWLVLVALASASCLSGLALAAP